MQETKSETVERADADFRRLNDAACKQLLGDKLILACILRNCAKITTTFLFDSGACPTVST